jgi:hypothetical protein
VRVVQRGDATLNTAHPVEAVLCLEKGVGEDAGTCADPRGGRGHVMRVMSIAALPGHELPPRAALVECALGLALPRAPAAASVLVEHLELFAAVHGASRPHLALRVDYDVWGERRGTVAAATAAAPAATATATSGFSVRSGGAAHTAVASLWVRAEGPDAAPGSSHPDPVSVTCFDAGGILSREHLLRALSKCAWARRAGLKCARGRDGSLSIGAKGRRLARVVLYLYPNEAGSAARVVGDTPEGMVRSAVNTALSAVATRRADGAPPGDAVPGAIDRIAACLGAVDGRRRADRGPADRGPADRGPADRGPADASSRADAVGARLRTMMMMMIII